MARVSLERDIDTPSLALWGCDVDVVSSIVASRASNKLGVALVCERAITADSETAHW